MLVLFILVLFCPVALASKITECEHDPYSTDNSISTYIINLDLPPQKRWEQVILDKHSYVHSTLPSPYAEELEGISHISKMPLSYVTLFNIFYEVFTVCTSIIIQGENGELYHGRNLDFGLFMGWDTKNHTWRVTEFLRPLTVHLIWIKGNRTIFESVNFVGYIGILTAVKKDAFTFSLDERFSLNGGFLGIIRWILFHDYKQKWVSFLTREVLEFAASYDEAQKMLKENRLLAPVYFILGGTNPGEGVVITRSRSNFSTLHLNSKPSGIGSWFLVETNYDNWESPPFFDDRRSVAVKCLIKWGQNNVSFDLLHNVLLAKPVLNKLTTYMSLMDAKKGILQSRITFCRDPCWPW